MQCALNRYGKLNDNQLYVMWREITFTMHHLDDWQKLRDVI